MRSIGKVFPIVQNNFSAIKQTSRDLVAGCAFEPNIDMSQSVDGLVDSSDCTFAC